MAINANFYNFNGIANGSELDYTQVATDLNNDSFYDLTLPAGQGSSSGWFRIEFDSPVDLSSFISGSYNHSFYNLVSVDGNYDSVSGPTSYFPTEYDYGGGSPPLSIYFRNAEDHNGSIDRYNVDYGDTGPYASVSALNYSVYLAEGIQDDFQATINVDFSNLTTSGAERIGNYYQYGSQGAGYYEYSGNEIDIVDPSSYLGADATRYRYGPQGEGVYLSPNGSRSVNGSEIGTQVFYGTDDPLATGNYTYMENGYYGEGFYENTGTQPLGNMAEAYDTNRPPQFYTYGAQGSGWYLAGSRSRYVGSGTYYSESSVPDDANRYYYGSQGSGYYAGSVRNGDGSNVGTGQYYGSYYSYGSQGSGFYRSPHGSADDNAMGSAESGATFYGSYTNSDNNGDGYMDLYRGNGPNGSGYYTDVKRELGGNNSHDVFYYASGSNGGPGGIFGSGSGEIQAGSEREYYGWFDSSNPNYSNMDMGSSGFLTGGYDATTYWYKGSGGSPGVYDFYGSYVGDSDALTQTYDSEGHNYGYYHRDQVNDGKVQIGVDEYLGLGNGSFDPPPYTVNGSGSTVYYAHGQGPSDVAEVGIEGPFVQGSYDYYEIGFNGAGFYRGSSWSSRNVAYDSDTYIGRSDQLYNISDNDYNGDIAQGWYSSGTSVPEGQGTFTATLPADAQLVASGSNPGYVFPATDASFVGQYSMNIEYTAPELYAAGGNGDDNTPIYIIPTDGGGDTPGAGGGDSSGGDSSGGDTAVGLATQVGFTNLVTDAGAATVSMDVILGPGINNLTGLHLDLD